LKEGSSKRLRMEYLMGKKAEGRVYYRKEI
jgi:hypothetical protein